MREPEGQGHKSHKSCKVAKLQGMLGLISLGVIASVHPRVVGESAGLPSRVVTKLSGWNKV